MTAGRSGEALARKGQPREPFDFGLPPRLFVPIVRGVDGVRLILDGQMRQQFYRIHPPKKRLNVGDDSRQAIALLLCERVCIEGLFVIHSGCSRLLAGWAFGVLLQRRDEGRRRNQPPGQPV
jgi:hypothetical protein